MKTSLFDTTVRDILYKSINPKFLQTGGFKTYPYIDECIVPLIDKYDSEKDRAINAGTINDDTSVWLIGHYDYSKVTYDETDYTSGIYIGKSIIPTVVGERRDIKDKYNVVFDTSILNRLLYPNGDMNDIDKMKIVVFYWDIILLNLSKDTDLNVWNTMVFNLEIKSLPKYMYACALYHLYNLLTKDWLKSDTIFEHTELPDDFFEVFTERDYLKISPLNHISISAIDSNEKEFRKFIELVKLYTTK